MEPSQLARYYLDLPSGVIAPLARDLARAYLDIEARAERLECERDELKATSAAVARQLPPLGECKRAAEARAERLAVAIRNAAAHLRDPRRNYVLHMRDALRELDAALANTEEK
jgi:hypothetical protein